MNEKVPCNEGEERRCTYILIPPFGRISCRDEDREYVCISCTTAAISVDDVVVKQPEIGD